MFSVPTRTQYGIRALVHLVKEGEAGLSASDIAEHEGISPKYLEGILSLLKTNGLITSTRGKNGGYKLSKNPKELTMLEIVEALDGAIQPTECIDSEKSCSKGTTCMSRKFWTELKITIDTFLRSKTLEDICTQKEGLL